MGPSSRRARYAHRRRTRHGAELYRAACSLDLEGIVAKWKHGPYVGDDVATSWVKIKNPGYSQSKGRHEQFTRFRHLSLSQ
jgi:ATP-dependent DNA ligase